MTATPSLLPKPLPQPVPSAPFPQALPPSDAPLSVLPGNGHRYDSDNQQAKVSRADILCTAGFVSTDRSGSRGMFCLDLCSNSVKLSCARKLAPETYVIDLRLFSCLYACPPALFVISVWAICSCRHTLHDCQAYVICCMSLKHITLQGFLCER